MLKIKLIQKWYYYMSLIIICYKKNWIPRKISLTAICIQSSPNVMPDQTIMCTHIYVTQGIKACVL